MDDGINNKPQEHNRGRTSGESLRFALMQLNTGNRHDPEKHVKPTAGWSSGNDFRYLFYAVVGK